MLKVCMTPATGGAVADIAKKDGGVLSVYNGKQGKSCFPKSLPHPAGSNQKRR